MSRCAGAGREHSQAASPGWPRELFHTTDIMLSLWMGAGRGGQESALLFAMNLNPLLSRSSNFSKSLVFFRNFMKFGTSRFCYCFSGTGCKSVVGWWENHIVYNLFSYSSLVLVFTLLPYETVFISTHEFYLCLFLLPHWGASGRVSERLSSA